MATATATGRIAQVIGSTFDAEFDEGHLPNIYNALTVTTQDKGVNIRLTGEVQQHLGGNRVRCVALGSTDGLVRGMPVVDTGASVSVPVVGSCAKPVSNVCSCRPHPAMRAVPWVRRSMRTASCSGARIGRCPITPSGVPSQTPPPCCGCRA